MEGTRAEKASRKQHLSHQEFQGAAGKNAGYEDNKPPSKVLHESFFHTYALH